MKINSQARLAAGFLVLAGLTACQTQPAPNRSVNAPSSGVYPSTTTTASSSAPVSSVRAASAELNPTQGSNVRGKVSFIRVENGIRVVADVTGLKPGPHGFHIHEKGDCSAPDATSAGAHFNPYGTTHGDLHADQRHVGDFGNLMADNAGNAHVDFVDVRIAFEGLASIIGRAVIVHANPDDLVSQPAGNAGPRAACGVIEPVNR